MWSLTSDITMIHKCSPREYIVASQTTFMWGCHTWHSYVDKNVGPHSQDANMSHKCCIVKPSRCSQVNHNFRCWEKRAELSSVDANLTTWRFCEFSQWRILQIGMFESGQKFVRIRTTLLNSDSRMRVTCENIFCVLFGKSPAIMTHPFATMTHIEKALKTVTPPWHNRPKIFQAKRFFTFDRNVTFVVLFRSLFTVIVYRK